MNQYFDDESLRAIQKLRKNRSDQWIFEDFLNNNSGFKEYIKQGVPESVLARAAGLEKTRALPLTQRQQELVYKYEVKQPTQKEYALSSFFKNVNLAPPEQKNELFGFDKKEDEEVNKLREKFSEKYLDRKGNARNSWNDIVEEITRRKAEDAPRTGRALSFLSGITPHEGKIEKAVGQAYPFSKMAGGITKYAGLGTVASNVLGATPAAKVKSLMQAAEAAGKTYGVNPATIINGISESLKWGTAFAVPELTDAFSKKVSGKPLNFEDFVFKPVTNFFVGAAVAPTTMVVDVPTRIISKMGATGSTRALVELLKDGDIDKNDLINIGIMTAASGITEVLVKDSRTQQNLIRKAKENLLQKILNRNAAGEGAVPTEGAAEGIKPLLDKSETISKSPGFHNVIKEIAKDIPIGAKDVGKMNEAIIKGIENEAPAEAIMDNVSKILPATDYLKKLKPKEIRKFKKENLIIGKVSKKGKYKDLGKPNIGGTGVLEKGSEEEQRFFRRLTEETLKDSRRRMGKEESEKLIKDLTPIEIGEILDAHTASKIYEMKRLIFDTPMGTEPPTATTQLVGLEKKEVFKGNEEIGGMAYSRPIRYAVQHNPKANFELFDPLSKAYVEANKLTEEVIIELENAVKKMGLTNEDLNAIGNYGLFKPKDAPLYTGYRQIPKKTTPEPGVEFEASNIKYGKKTPKELTPKQREGWNYFRRKFDAGFKVFDVEGKAGYVQDYVSRIYKKDYKLFQKAAEGIHNLPPHVFEWFKKARTKEMADLKAETNILKIAKLYFKKGIKGALYNPILDHANSKVFKKLPVGMSAYMHDYVMGTLGYPSVRQLSWGASTAHWALKFLKKDLSVAEGMDLSKTITRTLLDHAYAGTLGFRAESALRNMFQTFNNTLPIVGGLWLGKGLAQFTLKGYGNLEAEGILPKETVPETYKDKELSRYMEGLEKVRDAGFILFKNADYFNRSVANYAAEAKWDFYEKHFDLQLKENNLDSFVKWTEVDKLRLPVRQKIIRALLQQDRKKARLEFRKEIVAKTQYLYSKEQRLLMTDTPHWQAAAALGSWPIRYLNLINDSVDEKNWLAGLRWISVHIAAGLLAGKLKNKAQKHFITKNFGLNPLKRVEINPIDNIVTTPLMLTWRLGNWIFELPFDDNIKEFRKDVAEGLKIFGKSLWLYVPGGLAMKDYYEYYGWLEKKTTKPKYKLKK